MKILIKYHDINIKIGNLGSISVSHLFKIDTRKELSEFLYRILDQHKLYGNRTLYLDKLSIERSYNSEYLPNRIIEYQFNEVIQSLIDVKEHSRICAYEINNIILNVKFNASKDISSTKLVEKLIQVYNTSKSIIISLDTGIALSEIQKSIADRDGYFCHLHNQIVLNAKREMNPNTTLLLNGKDINASREASQYNDEVTKEELEITKYRTVEDGLVEEVVEPIDLTLPRYMCNSFD